MANVESFCKRKVYPMEILRNNFHVGMLNDDGEIHTEDPELAELDHALRTHGMIVMGNFDEPNDEGFEGEGVDIDYCEIKFPNKENLHLVVDALREAGYIVASVERSIAC